MKKCFRCLKVLSEENFYKHPQMADGLLGKCKQCCRQAAINNRLKRLEYYRQYDRDRMATGRRKASLSERQRRYRASNPQKNRARSEVAKAIKSGILSKKPCEVCGQPNVDAHHDDYSKPLDVRWLCRVHHLMEHGNYIA